MQPTKHIAIERFATNDRAAAPWARVTLILDAARSVTIGLADPTCGRLCRALTEALKHLRKGQRQGDSVTSVERRLRERARRRSRTCRDNAPRES